MTTATEALRKLEAKFLDNDAFDELDSAPATFLLPTSRTGSSRSATTIRLK